MVFPNEQDGHRNFSRLVRERSSVRCGLCGQAPQGPCQRSSTNCSCAMASHWAARRLPARTAVSQEGGDPTWLAYSVYGNGLDVIHSEAKPHPALSQRPRSAAAAGAW